MNHKLQTLYKRCYRDAPTCMYLVLHKLFTRMVQGSRLVRHKLVLVLYLLEKPQGLADLRQHRCTLFLVLPQLPAVRPGWIEGRAYGQALTQQQWLGLIIAFCMGGTIFSRVIAHGHLKFTGKKQGGHLHREPIWRYNAIRATCRIIKNGGWELTRRWALTRENRVNDGGHNVLSTYYLYIPDRPNWNSWSIKNSSSSRTYTASIIQR